jgi:hypothetical protein
MKPSLSVLTKFSIIAVIIAAGFTAMAQDNRIVIHLIDGRNGKPVSNEHLLIFQGASPEDIKEHRSHLDLQTDANGIAFLPTDAMPQIQVWPDWHKICRSAASNSIFSLEEIKKNGAATPNSCGSTTMKLVPNHFYIFARPLNFREKMRL